MSTFPRRGKRVWAHVHIPPRWERGRCAVRCVEIVAFVRVRPAADFVRVCRVSDYVGAAGVRNGRKCYDHSYSSWAYFFVARARGVWVCHQGCGCVIKGNYVYLY